MSTEVTYKTGPAFEQPERCPMCGTALENAVSVYLIYCTNTACPYHRHEEE